MSRRPVPSIQLPAPGSPRSRAAAAACAALGAAVLGACAAADPRSAPAPDGTFVDDLAFLQRHVDTTVLTSPTGARVALAAAFQGRVMTSTTGGERGESLGWIDRAAVAAGGRAPAGGGPAGGPAGGPGGEDRFELGPEGGPFALFFAPGSEFTPEHRRPPAAIDREPWNVLARRADRVVFGHRFELTNRAGTRLRGDVRREVELRDPAAVLAQLGCELPAGVRAVAFESINTVTNAGRERWRKESGLPAIRVAGSFATSPGCAVLVPFVAGRERYHGPIADVSPAPPPAGRLRIDEERGLLTLRAAGEPRVRVGVSVKRAKPVLGCWDEARGVLTIVELTLPIDARDYVTARWGLHDDPYAGDVVDGTTGGAGAGGTAGSAAPCELASSSPALALGPGESATHVHRTLHLVGTRESLAGIARQVLGADLAAPNPAN